MTTINGQPQLPPVTPAKEKQIETKMGEFLNGGATQHQRGNANHGTGGQARSNSSLLVSQGALEQLLETPQQQRQQGDDAMEDSTDSDAQDDSTQVLITLTPEKMGGKDAPTTQPTIAVNQQIKVDEVAKLVARQMDAALRTGPVVTPLPISLSIPLDASTGLKEVQVMMNDGSLTVTVLRSADQAMHDIKQAALNLAQVLQSRYPTKTIKIAEKADDGAEAVDQTAEAGMQPPTHARLFDFLSNDTDR
ncbi:MAG: hypothetical protein AAFP85_15180 [Pseudomonadota bacterium]